jgi:hypothetical protein
MNPSKIILLLMIIFFISLSCGNEKLKIEQPPPDEIEFIAPLGKKIAGALATSLKDELKAAMENGGVEKAISVCNVKALPLTDSVALNSSFHVSIKRISNLVRNPKNTPNEQEKLALDLFTELLKRGDELPEFYIQKITGENTVEYNYYRPIKMESLCLVCHGDKYTMAPNAAKIVNQFYPQDQATGYKEGDFRGLIRIKFYEPPL